MYEALVARVRYHIQKGEFMGLKEAESTCLLREAADAIEELQAGEKKFLRNISTLEMENENLKRGGRWIPVTERLPEMIDGENISKEVYVTDGTEIAKACIMRDYDGVAGWTYTGIGKITHWCEQIQLPQPPKEE